jgi:hypothetical protein
VIRFLYHLQVFERFSKEKQISHSSSRGHEHSESENNNPHNIEYAQSGILSPTSPPLTDSIPFEETVSGIFFHPFYFYFFLIQVQISFLFSR